MPVRAAAVCPPPPQHPDGRVSRDPTTSARFAWERQLQGRPASWNATCTGTPELNSNYGYGIVDAAAAVGIAPGDVLLGFLETPDAEFGAERVVEGGGAGQIVRAQGDVADHSLFSLRSGR